jgi:hypothetical protein
MNLKIILLQVVLTTMALAAQENTYENDPVPLGNGDIAADVWAEQNGDLMLLVAKAHASRVNTVPGECSIVFSI